MNSATAQHESSIFQRLLMSPGSAEAILSLRFSLRDEQRMRELMELNNQGTITSQEKAEMEAYRQIGSFLAIMQATAKLHLKHDSTQRNAG